MFTKVSQLEVDEANPFQNDALGRKILAENLTSLCAATKTPYVLALDAPWGYGKTTFLQMWEKMLRNEGFATLQFNAWESDHMGDGGIAFMGEIQAAIAQNKIELSKHPKAMAAWEKAKAISGKALARVVPIGLKLATQGLLDIEALKSVLNDNGEIAELVEESARNQIDQYVAQRESLDKFKTQLELFARNLSEEGEGKKPLVFLVDELDRCKPTFALDLLERLKHVFSVKGIIFVLSTDLKALSDSVQGVYGNSFDGKAYLKRFVDFTIEIPPPESEAYISYVVNKLGLRDIALEHGVDNREIEIAIKHLDRFAKTFCFSLRTIEQCLSEIYTLVAMTPPQHRVLTSQVSTLVGLRHSRRDSFRSFIDGRIGANELCRILESDQSHDSLFAGQTGAYIRAYLFYWSQIANEANAEYKRIDGLVTTSTSVPTADKEYAGYLHTAMQYLYRNDASETGRYLRQRMQLIYRRP